MVATNRKEKEEDDDSLTLDDLLQEFAEKIEIYRL